MSSRVLSRPVGVEEGRPWPPKRCVRQVLGAEHVTGAEHGAAFDRVSQLAHVAGPRVALQQVHGFVR